MQVGMLPQDYRFSEGKINLCSHLMSSNSLHKVGIPVNSHLYKPNPAGTHSKQSYVIKRQKVTSAQRGDVSGSLNFLTDSSPDNSSSSCSLAA